MWVSAERLLVPAIILLFGTLPLCSQFQEWPPTPQRFGIYRFDSSFVLGVHTILSTTIAVDSFHMRFSQEYAKSTAVFDRLINVPGGGGDWIDSLDHQRFQTALEKGFQYIYLPNSVSEFVNESRNDILIEAYPMKFLPMIEAGGRDGYEDVSQAVADELELRFIPYALEWFNLCAVEMPDDGPDWGSITLTPGFADVIRIRNWGEDWAAGNGGLEGWSGGETIH